MSASEETTLDRVRLLQKLQAALIASGLCLGIGTAQAGDVLFANGFEGVTLLVPSTPVAINTAFQVSWTSIGTTSCDMSGGSAGWAGNGRASSGTLNLTAPANAGSVAFNISCATTGVAVSDTGNVTFQVPPPASIAVNDVAVVEGNSGTINAVFTVTLTGTAQGGFTVPFSSANVTASAGSDYTAIPGGSSLSFTGTAGQTRTISVPVTGDLSIESDETFQVLLGTPTGGVSLADGIGIGTIINDDVASCVPAYPNGVVTLWNATFNTWPSYGVRRSIVPPANGYRALRFTATNQVNQFGSISLTDYPGDGDGFAVLSISREPGCFDQAHLGPNCLIAPARFATIGWINGSSERSCQLTPGQDYYINMTYGSANSGLGPYCPAGQGNCGADVTSLIQD